MVLLPGNSRSVTAVTSWSAAATLSPLAVPVASATGRVPSHMTANSCSGVAGTPPVLGAVAQVVAGSRIWSAKWNTSRR